MKVQLSATELSLARRQTLRLADPTGVRITAMRGTLWVTQDHDPRDTVLQAGESIGFESARPVIVQALAPACIALLQTRDARRAPRSLARRLRDLGAVLVRPAWAGAARPGSA